MKSKKVMLVGLLLSLFLMMGVVAANENTTACTSEIDGDNNLMNINEKVCLGQESIENGDFEVNEENMLAKSSENVSGTGPEADLTYASNNDTSPILQNGNSKVILTVKKAYSTTKSYVKLRAVVEDSDYSWITEGVVNFTINGETYSVPVNEYGNAIKKIKLTEPGTYDLEATFSSDNYGSKTVSSQVVVSKAKEYYKIKIGKYSCKVSFKVYKKILDAKSWNSVFYKKYDTHKKLKVKYYTGHGKTKSKPKYKTCKVYITIDTYRWSKNHDVRAKACTDSDYLRNLYKDYNYYSKEIVL